AALSEYIRDHLTRAGVSVQRDEEGNVTAEVGRGERLLVVNGHMDTVPPVDGWKADPFMPRVEDGRFYGLGASDMKAGLACMMWLAQHVRPHVRTWFAFTNHEEGGSITPRNGVRRLIGRARPDYAVTTEPSYDDATGRLSVGIGCQGRAIASLTVLGRSGHSSDWRRADNAIYRGVDVITRIAAIADANGHTLAVAREALEKTQGVAPVQFSQGRQDLSIFAERTRDFCNLGPGSIGQPHKANESASVAGMVAAANALRDLIEAI